MAGTVLAYTSPGKPTGLVNDFAGVLSAGQRAALENKLGNFERPAGVQVAVVTVTSLGGDTIEDYAVKLFQEWGIGQKLSDNGLLLLVAPNDREARIEVGYGLEPTVTDAASSVIVNSIMIPAFKTGDYYGGIDKGTDKIMGLIEGDPETQRFVTQNSRADMQGNDQNAPQSVPIFVPIVCIVLFIILASTRWGRRILFYFFISGLFGGGRGGRGNGSSGGGFSGFGGGRSGGGGASGRW